MHLKTLARGFCAREQRHSIGRLNLPELPRIAKVADDISRRRLVVKALPSLELGKLEARLQLAVKNGDFRAITSRDWSRSPYVFWGSGTPIAESEEFVTAFFCWLTDSGNTRVIHALIYAYVSGFDLESKLIGKIGSALQSFLTAPHSTRYNVWHERSERYSLFQPRVGPARVADHVLCGDDEVEDVFDSVGLGRERIWSAFGRQTLREAITVADTFTVRPASESVAVVNRLRHWLELRMPLKDLSQDFKCFFLSKFLEQWKKRDPGPPLLEVLKRLAQDMLGDPRANNYGWGDERLIPSRKIILRWFAVETIDSFFAVIDKAADHWYWEDRTSFWSSYHKAGAITDAWVAFGPNVMPVARAARDKHKQFRFATLTDPNDRLHSILFLRIRDLLIADYSHSGSCRFFYTENTQTPQLYESDYLDRKIRELASDAIAHRGAWQQKFASYIYEHTGVKPPVSFR
jgi:hypothetical protein